MVLEKVERRACKSWR